MTYPQYAHDLRVLEAAAEAANKSEQVLPPKILESLERMHEFNFRLELNGGKLNKIEYDSKWYTFSGIGLSAVICSIFPDYGLCGIVLSVVLSLLFLKRWGLNFGDVLSSAMCWPLTLICFYSFYKKNEIIRKLVLIRRTMSS